MKQEVPPAGTCNSLAIAERLAQFAIHTPRGRQLCLKQPEKGQSFSNQRCFNRYHLYRWGYSAIFKWLTSRAKCCERHKFSELRPRASHAQASRGSAHFAHLQSMISIESRNLCFSVLTHLKGRGKRRSGATTYHCPNPE